MANRTTMPNRGEKAVSFRTSEGHNCLLKMQVTDVPKPLLSVSRVCDSGHRVVFHSRGGYIQHEITGQVTHFFRDSNVYRMEGAPTRQPASSGSTWQGE